MKNNRINTDLVHQHVRISSLRQSLYPVYDAIRWYNMSLLDHCLWRSLLELISNCHYYRTPSPLLYQPLPVLTLTYTRTGKTLEYFFLQNEESFLFLLVIKAFNIRVKGVLHLSNLKMYSRDVKHIDEYWCILCGNHRQLDLVSGRISEIFDLSQDIRPLPETRTVTEPAGEIRGGLQE